MPLADYLNEDGNTHAKEEMLNHRLQYDLKLAAAVRGYHLLSYYSNVDHDGFDAILDDRDLLKKCQVKTRMTPGGAATWPIRKHLLRPNLRTYEMFGYEAGPAGEGVQGGIILMELTPQAASIDLTYYYTDIYVIKAVGLGIIPRHGNVRNAANNLLEHLAEGPSSETVNVTQLQFLKAETPEHLLALAGFHSRFENNWRGMLARTSARAADVVLNPPEALSLDDLKAVTTDQLIHARGGPLG